MLFNFCFVLVPVGCNPVPRMPCILFGYLTFKPKSLVGSAATGSLFVEDNLGALACEVGNHGTLKVLCTK